MTSQFGWVFLRAGSILAVRSIVTVIGCWVHTSPYFPAFFGRLRTYMQTLLRLSVC